MPDATQLLSKTVSCISSETQHFNARLHLNFTECNLSWEGQAQVSRCGIVEIDSKPWHGAAPLAAKQGRPPAGTPSVTCSLSILVARTDIAFMLQTIPHLVRMCRYPFQQRVLVVDTAALSGDKVTRPGIGSLAQLQEYCNRLLKTGVIDRVLPIDYSVTCQKQTYQKHVGVRHVRPTHNYKGYPILGTMFSLDAVPGDYVLHFDSDMLLYQHSSYSWIDEAIRLLHHHPEVMFVRPMAGPPHADGRLPTGGIQQSGFHQFPTFGSRVYLLQRDRFHQLLPLPILWRSYKHALLNHLPGSVKTYLNYWLKRGKLDSWEVMVSQKLQKTSKIRANLDSPLAWTLHPNVRGDELIQALPQIIERIESGWYPDEQAGDYDLNLPAWVRSLKSNNAIGSK